MLPAGFPEQRCTAESIAGFITSELTRTQKISTADKVDDFQPVTILQCRLGPVITRHDFTIQFDGDAFPAHSELFDQDRQREARRKFSRFAIDYEIHQTSATTLLSFGASGTSA